MPNRKRFITCICLLMVIVGYQTTDAQQQLPFGAKARFGMDKGAISDVAFTPDGTRLAIASRIGVWLYEAATGEETALEPATPFDVSAIAFTPDGKTLTTVSRNGTIRFWNTTNGDQRFPAVAHKRVGTVLAFSPDGTILTTVGLRNTIRLWNVRGW